MALKLDATKQCAKGIVKRKMSRKGASCNEAMQEFWRGMNGQMSNFWWN